MSTCGSVAKSVTKKSSAVPKPRGKPKAKAKAKKSGPGCRCDMCNAKAKEISELRKSLQTVKKRALISKAETIGVKEDALDAAVENGTSQDIIELILEQARITQESGSAATDDFEEALRQCAIEKQFHDLLRCLTDGRSKSLQYVEESHLREHVGLAVAREIVLHLRSGMRFPKAQQPPELPKGRKRLPVPPSVTEVQAEKSTLENVLAEIRQWTQEMDESNERKTELQQTIEHCLRWLTRDTGGVIILMLGRSDLKHIPYGPLDKGVFASLLDEYVVNIKEKPDEFDILMTAFCKPTPEGPYCDRWDPDLVRRLESDLLKPKGSFGKLEGEPKDGALILDSNADILGGSEHLKVISEDLELVKVDGTRVGTRHASTLAAAQTLGLKGVRGVSIARSDAGGIHICLPRAPEPPKVWYLQNDRPGTRQRQCIVRVSDCNKCDCDFDDCGDMDWLQKRSDTLVEAISHIKLKQSMVSGGSGEDASVKKVKMKFTCTSGEIHNEWLTELYATLVNRCLRGVSNTSSWIMQTVLHLDGNDPFPSELTEDHVKAFEDSIRLSLKEMDIDCEFVLLNGSGSILLLMPGEAFLKLQRFPCTGREPLFRVPVPDAWRTAEVRILRATSGCCHWISFAATEHVAREVCFDIEMILSRSFTVQMHFDANFQKSEKMHPQVLSTKENTTLESETVEENTQPCLDGQEKIEEEDAEASESRGRKRKAEETDGLPSNIGCLQDCSKGSGKDKEDKGGDKSKGKFGKDGSKGSGKDKDKDKDKKRKSSSSSKDKKIKLFVKTMTGKTFTIEMQTSDPISKIKATIFEREGIPANDQRLVYAGKSLQCLQDDNLLEDYNIDNEATIHLVLRLRYRERPSGSQDGTKGIGKCKAEKELSKKEAPVQQFSAGWENNKYYTHLLKGSQDMLPDWCQKGKFSLWAFSNRQPGTVQFSAGWENNLYYTHLLKGSQYMLPDWCQKGKFSFWAFSSQQPGTVQFSAGWENNRYYTHVLKGSQDMLPDWCQKGKFSFWAYPTRPDETKLQEFKELEKFIQEEEEEEEEQEEEQEQEVEEAELAE